ncbi:hypothetical protein SH2C18_39370 [Clostridium sediminicola]|uniref:alpha/beta fold hydrolase n=1 Tax=Clostridium sediminicola TaxID=3114879 RepID=UPI0031F2011D
MNHEPSEKDLEFLSDEIMKDHTNLDWRDLLPYINIPTMVLVARKSNVFPWQGSAYVAEKIPNSRVEFFEDCGHMLFWENPEKFNSLIKSFCDK